MAKSRQHIQLKDVVSRQNQQPMSIRSLEADHELSLMMAVVLLM